MARPGGYVHISLYLGVFVMGRILYYKGGMNRAESAAGYFASHSAQVGKGVLVPSTRPTFDKWKKEQAQVKIWLNRVCIFSRASSKPIYAKFKVYLRTMVCHAKTLLLFTAWTWRRSSPGVLIYLSAVLSRM